LAQRRVSCARADGENRTLSLAGFERATGTVGRAERALSFTLLCSSF
jgi:hypothetical protein